MTAHPIRNHTGRVQARVAWSGLGRVTHVQDDTGTTSVAYDTFSRPVQVTPSGGRKALTFEYAITGSRWRTQTFMAGVAQPWESWEDQKGRLVRQSNPFGQNTTWEYDRSGAPLAERRANGTQVQYGYDGFGRNTQIQHLTRQGTVLAPLETLGHVHDAAGRLWQEQSTTPAGTRTRSFTYDPLGRLTREQETYTAEPQFLADTQYFYDRNGNRTQVSRSGNREYYGYDAADKLIWTNTGSPFPPNATQPQRWTRYAYDDFGQQILRLSGGASPQRGVQQYQQDLKWDSAGRLREVQDRTTGGGTAVALSARYTADGERIEKSDPFTGTKLSSFGLFDTKTKGGVAEGTLHTPGISFRKGLEVSGGAVGTTGTDRFFHTDQLGSTRHLTDGTGTGTHSTTPSRMRFDAYGLPTQLEGADGWDATEYQYAGAWGYEREPNGSRLGLDYLYQRYYDPAVGKFISADPIGIAGGLNLYAYCENDPVNAVDPLGLAKDSIRASVEGALGAKDLRNAWFLIATASNSGALKPRVFLWFLTHPAVVSEIQSVISGVPNIMSAGIQRAPTCTVTAVRLFRHFKAQELESQVRILLVRPVDPNFGLRLRSLPDKKWDFHYIVKVGGRALDSLTPHGRAQSFGDHFKRFLPAPGKGPKETWKLEDVTEKIAAYERTGLAGHVGGLPGF